MCYAMFTQVVQCRIGALEALRLHQNPFRNKYKLIFLFSTSMRDYVLEHCRSVGGDNDLCAHIRYSDIDISGKA